MNINRHHLVAFIIGVVFIVTAIVLNQPLSAPFGGIGMALVYFSTFLEIVDRKIAKEQRR